MLKKIILSLLWFMLPAILIFWYHYIPELIYSGSWYRKPVEMCSIFITLVAFIIPLFNTVFIACDSLNEDSKS